jgi:hypothetical protein
MIALPRSLDQSLLVHGRLWDADTARVAALDILGRRHQANRSRE